MTTDGYHDQDKSSGPISPGNAGDPQHHLPRLNEFGGDTMQNDATGSEHQCAAARDLDWPNCYNVRDLGGLPTRNKQTTQWRAVVRGDILNRLTPAGEQALREYGIRTVIDLRGADEVADEPSLAAMNSRADISYVNLPLEGYDPQVSALISQAASRPEVYCLVLDHYRARVAAVVQAIADAEPGGVLIHCHAGKDRTGMIAALLLRLVDVPADVIAADYAHSQARLWPLYAQLVRDAGGEEQVGWWLKPIATPEMMHTMLAYLDAQHGGVEEYLITSGVKATTLRRLRRRLAPT